MRPVLGPRHQFPLGSPAFPLFQLYETTTAMNVMSSCSTLFCHATAMSAIEQFADIPITCFRSRRHHTTPRWNSTAGQQPKIVWMHPACTKHVVYLFIYLCIFLTQLSQNEQKKKQKLHNLHFRSRQWNTRLHNLQLPQHTGRLTDSNFLTRMLYRDSCWLYKVLFAFSTICVLTDGKLLIKNMYVCM